LWSKIAPSCKSTSFPGGRNGDGVVFPVAFFALDLAPMRAQELLWLSDWLNELAVFGNPKHLYDSETATHCSQALKYRHLVVLAIEPLSGNKKGGCWSSTTRVFSKARRNRA
jgi:hypothetical protein